MNNTPKKSRPESNGEQLWQLNREDCARRNNDQTILRIRAYLRQKSKAMNEPVKQIKKAVLILLSGLLSTGSSIGQSVVTLEWDPVPGMEIAGYKLYYGPASREYTGTNVVLVPQTTSTVTNLAIGERYYFAVTAFTEDGLESLYSDECIFDPRTFGKPMRRSGFGLKFRVR